jgi:hypothetical protein
VVSNGAIDDRTLRWLALPWGVEGRGDACVQPADLLVSGGADTINCLTPRLAQNEVRHHSQARCTAGSPDR